MKTNHYGRGAGRYNSPGTIQKNVPADPTQPQLVPNWLNVANDWFEVSPKSGNDARKFEQLHPTVSHIVRCRYSSNTKGIVPTRFRILLENGTQVLNVQAAFDLDSRRVEMELQCTEVKL